MFRQRGRIAAKSHQQKSVPVVAHGVVSRPDIISGQFLPVIVIDASSRPDIEEHIRLHKGTGPYDVKSTWAEVPGEGRVCLVLEFQGPTANVLIIRFNLSGQLKSVDRILHQQVMHLMCGAPGNKVSDLYENAPGMIIEVRGTWPLPKWNKFLQKALIEEAKKAGLNRKDAKQVAIFEIENWRAQSAAVSKLAARDTADD